MAQLLKRIYLNVNWTYVTCGNKTTFRFKSGRGNPSRIGNFDAIQEERRSQALRSILFVHRSSKDNLLRFCSNYGKIGNAFFFKKPEYDVTSNSNYQQMALIEFCNKTVVDRLLDGTKHFPNARRIPMRSQNLYYMQNQSTNYGFSQNIRNIPRLDITDYGINNLSDGQLMDCQSIDEQMDLIHERQSMSELDVRLRYFIAGEVENLSRRFYPHSRASLFGSSVTGLGRYNGDADITLNIEPYNPYAGNGEGSMESCTTYFMSKIRSEDERRFGQVMVQTFGSIMNHMVPQMVNVKSILGARIPIVKFKHSTTDVDGDLCISNGEAIEMSRALHHLMHYHPSVLPLTFTIRQWAKHQHITRSISTQCLSNFMLTLLVVFYLQKHPQVLLPSVKDFHQSGEVNRKVKEDIDKENLLTGFFKFYSELDFSKNGISVYEGSFVDIPETKNNDFSDLPVTAAIHLVNPIERHLNAAKIVEKPHLVHFQEACVRSLDVLSKSPKSNFVQPWGLLTILNSCDVSHVDFEVENLSSSVEEKVAI